MTMPEPITLGTTRLGPPVFLAPMAGITDLPFRRAVARHGGVPPYDETKDYVLKVVDRYFMLRLRYPDEGIGVIHQKLVAGDTSPAKTEKP